MINAQKDLPIIKDVLSSPTADYFILHTEEQIQDILMFCCKDPAAVLGTDITFGLHNLWVTDTSYGDERLLNPKTGKHPVFLGPSMMHFTKGHLVFSRFAVELLAANPSLRDLRVIGVDMEEAIFGDLKPLFQH